MHVLRIIVNILNLGIDYDLKRGDHASAQAKIKARDRILDQLLTQS